MPIPILNASMARVYLLCLVLGCSSFAQVNAVTDCSLPAAPADSCAAFQACLDNNPGRHILIHANNAALIDSFTSSCSLHMKGNAQWLDGDTPAGHCSGGTALRFTGNGGIVASFALDGTQGGKISNLTLQGSTAQPGAEGLQISTAEFKVEDSCVNNFPSYGVHITNVNNGLNGDNANLWHLEDLRIQNSGSDGLKIDGLNAGVGIAERVDLRANHGWAINDQSAYGNVFISPQADGNTGCYNTRVASVQNGTWINAYCEGGQAASVFGSSNMVLGGFHGAGPGTPVYGVSGWWGNTFGLTNNSGGNIALRMRAAGYKSIYFSDNADHIVSSISANPIGGIVINNLVVFGLDGTEYLTKLRFTQVFQSDGSPVLGASCGSGKDIVWAISPNVGDFVGYRCLGGAWHGFGVIQ